MSTYNTYKETCLPLGAGASTPGRNQLERVEEPVDSCGRDPDADAGADRPGHTDLLAARDAVEQRG